MHFPKLVCEIRDSFNNTQNGKEVNKCHLSAQVMENRYFLISDKLKRKIVYLFKESLCTLERRIKIYLKPKIHLIFLHGRFLYI